MRRLLSLLLDVGYLLAGLVYLPVVVYRLLFAGRYRHRWPDRLGLVPRRYGDRPCLWLHAVSVGEVNAIRTLVDRLRQQLPFHEVFISTTTDTGYGRAAGLFGADRVFFFPFDFSWSVASAFRRLRPSLVILAELEVWPNLVIEAKRRAVPVIVVNGRVTKRSADRYRLAGPLTGWVFGQLDAALVQDQTYGRRFGRLGVDPTRISRTGSLKWDAAQVDDSTISCDALTAASDAVGLDRGKPLLVAGSTADTIEEEAIIRAYQQLRAHYPDLQLVIAPRKPERFGLVAKLIESRGFKVVRRSRHADGTQTTTGGAVVASAVVLLDTIGELRRFYAMATVVIVGRTFVPLGGSDVMEIAALGKPMVLGPSIDNFADAVSKLVDSGAAVRLAGTAKLAATIEGLLGDCGQLEAMGASARQVVRDEQGATQRTAETICRLLGYTYDQTTRGIATPELAERGL